MQPVGDDVQAQDGGVLGADQDRVGEPLAERLLRGRAEGLGVVGHDDLARDGAVVQHGEGGVEVVVARVDQLERDQLDALLGELQALGHLGVAGGRGAEAGAGEQQLADEQQVALALHDLDRLAEPAVALGGRRAEPAVVRRALRRALRVGEPGGERPPADDDAAVGRVDHVGQARLGLDDVDLVTAGLVGRAERLPLGERLGGVDGRGRVHPRVDGVDDVEVRGRAHEVVPRGGGPLRGGLRHGARLRPHRFTTGTHPLRILPRILA